MRGAAPEPRAGAARPAGRAEGAPEPEIPDPVDAPTVNARGECSAETAALVAGILKLPASEAMAALARAVQLF